MSNEPSESEQASIKTEPVVVHAGSRTFFGFTPLSEDEFDRRGSTGRSLTIHGAVEIAHLAVINGGAMQNLVSMTGVDHMLTTTEDLRVKPSSWYFVKGQAGISPSLIRGVYNSTLQNMKDQAAQLVADIEAEVARENAEKEALESAPEADDEAKDGEAVVSTS